MLFHVSFKKFPYGSASPEVILQDAKEAFWLGSAEMMT